MNSRLLIAVVAVVTAGCASEPADDDQDLESSNDALINGSLTVERPEIGKLMLPGSDCTATLIAPTVVITAAHCFGFQSSKGAVDTTFRVHSSQSDYKSYKVAEYVSLGTSPGVNDVALARLSTAVPSSRAVPTRVASSRPANGTPLSMYGFGKISRLETASANAEKNYKKRRYDFVQGTSTREAAIGDSGGPVIDRTTGAVVGIISGYNTSTGIDVFGDVPARASAIASRVATWTGTTPPSTPSTPPPAACGAWQPYTQWTCSGDGVTRGRCGAAGVEFQRCTTRCVPASGGAVCQ